MHPMKKESVAGHNAKLRRMTRHYGDADPTMRQSAPVDEFAASPPDEEVPEFGSDSMPPRARADRIGRRAIAANPVPTYNKGGRIKGRAEGGRVKGRTNVNVIVMPPTSPGQGGPNVPPPVLPTGNPPVPPGSATPLPPMPLMAPALPPNGIGTNPAVPPIPRRRGGRVHHTDVGEDKALIRSMVKRSALKGRAKGGRIHMTAGAESGEGRLEKARARAAHARHEKPQEV
jgi:hypothetical protein